MTGTPKVQLQAPQVLAQGYRALRTAAFAFCLLVFCLLWIERGHVGVGEVLGGVFIFAIYPQLAWLHTRRMPDAKQAEQRNLYADALLLGLWSAQIHFALLPCVGMLVALCLNGASNGDVPRLLRTLGLYVAGAVGWSLVTGFEFHAQTGPLVATASAAGILLYVTMIGLYVYRQNRSFARQHHALLASEQQFRFIADNVADLVAMLDLEGRLLYASASYARKFGAEVVAQGLAWLPLVHPEEREQAAEFLKAVSSRPGPRSMVLRMVTTDGRFYFIDCKANPVFDQAGKALLVVLICNDLSRLLDA